MKENILRIVSCLITVSLIVIACNRLGFLLRPVETDVSINNINTFHDMPDNAFEVICYGSSHMWRGLSTMYLYDNYGIGAYNYGCNWQQIDTTKLFVYDSLQTQNPKVVIIDTFLANAYKENVDMEGEVYYTTAIKDSSVKLEYLKKCFGKSKERFLSYYMPLCAFHDNWININETSFKKSVDYSFDFYDSKGTVESTYIMPTELPDYTSFGTAELDSNAVEFLDDIVDMCKERNIDVVFITIPYTFEFPYAEAYTNYARDKGCEYINFFEHMDEIGLDEENDFSDDDHLNSYGAQKIAEYMGRYLIENYDLTDFREDPNNIWERDRKHREEN